MTGFGLVVPERVKAEIENEAVVDRQVGSARYIDRALKAFDRELSLVWIKPDIPKWELPVGAVPARWHVRKESPGFVAVYFPVQTPNGDYLEPTVEGVLSMMREKDLHNPQVMRAVTERAERKRAEEARAEALRDEQRRDELDTDLRAGRRVPGEDLHKRKAWRK